MNKNEVYRFLDQKQIWHEITEHPAVYNMEQLEQVTLPYPGCDAKNLFVRDDKRRNYYLITVKGDKRVNLKDFRRQQGTKPLTFASPEELAEILGLIPGAVMAPFSQVTAGYIPAWGVLTLACLALGVVRYTYYYQGSRSIYLMRRLPDRWELWRRTLEWPLVLAVLLALLAAILLGAFRLGYLWTVPAEAMAE